MTIDYISAGDTVTCAIRVMVAGAGVDATAVCTVKIQRASDGFWLDDDNAFRAYADLAFFGTRDLVAVDDDASRYAYVWNTSTIVNPVAGDIYFATIDVSAPYAYSTTGTISTAMIPAVRSGLATAANVTSSTSTITSAITSAVTAIDGHTDSAVAGLAVPGDAMTLTAGERTAIQAEILSDATPFPGANIDAAMTSRMATFAYTTPPTVGAISTQVRADLITDHGSGGWTTATGFATSGALDTAQSFLDSLDGKLTATQEALGALNTFTVASGSTASVVQTDCTDPDGTWDGQMLVSYDPTTNSRTISTRIVSQAGGVFSVSPPLPWIPGGSDTVVLRADLAVDQAAILTALTSSTTTTGNTISAAITTIDNHTTSALASIATTANVTAARDHIEAALAVLAGTGFTAGADDLHSLRSALSTLSAAVAGLPAAPAASVIAQAVADQDEGGAPGTLGWAIQLLRQWGTYSAYGLNKKKIVGTNLVIYDDDGVTPLITVPLKDIGGNAISTQAGEPTQIGS